MSTVLREKLYSQSGDGTKTILNKSERILFKFWRDFTDRRGLRQEWDGIDDEIQEEILQCWLKIIESEL